MVSGLGAATPAPFFWATAQPVPIQQVSYGLSGPGCARIGKHWGRYAVYTGLHGARGGVTGWFEPRGLANGHARLVVWQVIGWFIKKLATPRIAKRLPSFYNGYCSPRPRLCLQAPGATVNLYFYEKNSQPSRIASAQAGG